MSQSPRDRRRILGHPACGYKNAVIASELRRRWIGESTLNGFRAGFGANILLAGVLLGGCDPVLDEGYAAHLLFQSMSPEDASTSGGTVLTLHGAGFCDNMVVRLGDQAPAFLRVESSRLALVDADSPPPPGVASLMH